MSRPAPMDRRLRSVADTVGFTLLWGWILISLFFVPTMLGYWWLGAALSVLGLVVCWQAASASAYPVRTIGTKRRVDVEAVDGDVECDECGRPAAGGERRCYARETVLFGAVVARPERGENVYCPACATGAVARDHGPSNGRRERDETDGTVETADRVG